MFVTRVESRDLTFPSNRRTTDQRYPGCKRDIIENKPGLEVVGTIHDKVDIVAVLDKILMTERIIKGFDMNGRIDCP